MNQKMGAIHFWMFLFFSLFWVGFLYFYN